MKELEPDKYENFHLTKYIPKFCRKELIEDKLITCHNDYLWGDLRVEYPSDKVEFKLKDKSKYIILVDIVYIILLFFADWIDIITPFDDVFNNVMDVIVSIYGAIIASPIALIGIIELYSLSYTAAGLMIEYIPLHTVLALISFALRVSRKKTIKSSLKYAWDKNKKYLSSETSKLNEVDFYSYILNKEYRNAVGKNIAKKFKKIKTTYKTV